MQEEIIKFLCHDKIRDTIADHDYSIISCEMKKLLTPLFARTTNMIVKGHLEI